MKGNQVEAGDVLRDDRGGYREVLQVWRYEDIEALNRRLDEELQRGRPEMTAPARGLGSSAGGV